VDWLTRRRQLVEILVAEKNRSHQAQGAVRRDIEQHIDWLKKRIHDNERDLPKLLADCPAWNARCSCSTTRRASGVYRP